ncbi:FGGY-family carbohydrate kinase [Labrys sp. La1]|uniref:FGGY-family carbohydrate kinase n=1 Tax=Labrys sp. La1 TaxID=3404917 RepID=UPI003EC12234
MTRRYLIGLDYGTESARGVLVDADSGEQVASHALPYRHGVMTRLPDGPALPPLWALQNADDYVETAQAILSALGRDRQIEGIGLGFTASSPLPVTAEGVPLSRLHPREPHAYVKLWKHGAAQAQAEAINARGGAFLDNFGGKLSAEWLLAKAAQLAQEAPRLWHETERFIEAGDWLVWQLTGAETRSLGFAAYKAQYAEGTGYPDGIVPDLADRLTQPRRVGTSAGGMSPAWRERTGIRGQAAIAVAVIDSHVVLPAVGGVSDGCLVGALGTSAVYLMLGRQFRPLPQGIEGVAFDGSVRDLWCYESGQAGFGDTLAWFVKTFPRAAETAENFRLYNAEAAGLVPGSNHLLALDWWSGNRVPLADSGLSGLLVGLTTGTTAAGIYRALLESLAYGARSIRDLFVAGGFHIDRLILSSGLARNNPLLVQIMADVLAQEVGVPEIDNPTAVGAAIHGAVAAGVVADYPEGAARFGAREFKIYRPGSEAASVYADLYRNYAALAGDTSLRGVMHALNRIGNPR